MGPGRRRGGIAAVAATACVALAALAVARPQVDVRDDRVTASLAAVPIDDVLAALATATGAEIRGTPGAGREVTAELDAVPMATAMPRILGEQNFTLQYGSGGRLVAIVLRGGPEAPAPATDAVHFVEAPPAGPQAFPLVLGRAVARHRPLPLPDALAETLGATHASFGSLLDTAATAHDGVTRAQATQVVLSALERESRLRRTFLRSLYRLDDESLATLMHGETAERFQEMLEFLAAHSREPALQKKAAVFLDILRPADEAPPGS